MSPDSRLRGKISSLMHLWSTNSTRSYVTESAHLKKKSFEDWIKQNTQKFYASFVYKIYVLLRILFGNHYSTFECKANDFEKPFKISNVQKFLKPVSSFF